MTCSLQPQTMPIFQTLPMECPFAWQTESYFHSRGINILPSDADLTISFTTTRMQKILGYIPIIGTAIGIYTMHKALSEYRIFNNTHLHHLSRRSINWMIRGAIELFPIIGGIICIIADIVATCLLTKSPNHSVSPDETACGYCHTCPGCCQC